MARRLIDIADGWIQTLGPWGYIILGIAALAEYIFPPFPGDSVVALGGVWAWRASRSWAGVWFAVTFGNALGIGIQHYVGRALYQRVQRSKSGRLSVWLSEKITAWGMTEERIAAIQERIRKHGVALLLINRFFPSFRALVFLAAGASGMSLKKTLFWGVLGSLAWSGLILGFGALAGGNIERMHGMIERYQTAAACVVGAAVVLLALYGLYRWKRRKSQ